MEEQLALKRLVVSLISILTVALAAPQTSGGFTFPSGGGGMPNYYSGTNSRASGSAMVGPVEHAYLYLIGGGETTLVAEYHSDIFWYPLSISLSCMFDSSHFPPGTSVTTKLKVFVLGNSTPFVGLSPGVSVRNKAILFEDSDPVISPDAPPLVSYHLSGKNYDILQQNGGSWTSATYFNSMNGANAVLMSGHGSVSTHSVGVHETAYEPERVAHIGTGIPPMNSGAIPINFIHLIACNCGDTNAFLDACYPYNNIYSIWWTLENQALMAYKVYTAASEASLHAGFIWSFLAAGHTANFARERFDDLVLNNPGTFHCWDSNGFFSWRRFMQPQDIALYYGADNGSARIKSVYTGNDLPPISWHRPL